MGLGSGSQVGALRREESPSWTTDPPPHFREKFPQR